MAVSKNFEAARFLAAVGENVLTHRETAGMSQEDLAALTGLSVEVLDKIERGHADPRLLTLEAIAIALRAELGDLLEVSGSEMGLRPTRD